MPDAGDFEKGNASASPASWDDAFAAFPQEAPDAGAWQRLQARLPAAATPRVRVRWPLWLAAAASLGQVVALPLWMLPQGGSADSATAQKVSTGRPSTQPAQAASPIATSPTSVASSAATQPVTTPLVGRKKPRPANHVAPSHRPIRTIAQPVGVTRIATSDTSPENDLELLYAQSAQLESVLAMARDDHVSSGTSAALSDGLGAHVASIDAALMRPDLSHADQVALWGQRVEALRALASFEGTQRWLASQGGRDEGQLVVVD